MVYNEQAGVGEDEEEGHIALDATEPPASHTAGLSAAEAGCGQDAAACFSVSHTASWCLDGRSCKDRQT